MAEARRVSEWCVEEDTGVPDPGGLCPVDFAERCDDVEPFSMEVPDPSDLLVRVRVHGKLRCYSLQALYQYFRQLIRRGQPAVDPFTRVRVSNFQLRRVSQRYQRNYDPRAELLVQPARRVHDADVQGWFNEWEADVSRELNSRGRP